MLCRLGELEHLVGGAQGFEGTGYIVLQQRAARTGDGVADDFLGIGAADRFDLLGGAGELVGVTVGADDGFEGLEGAVEVSLLGCLGGGGDGAGGDLFFLLLGLDGGEHGLNRRAAWAGGEVFLKHLDGFVELAAFAEHGGALLRDIEPVGRGGPVACAHLPAGRREFCRSSRG